MGANLCTLSGTCLKDCIKPKQNRTFKRKKIEKKILPIGKKVALDEDWILSSSSSEMKHSKKRVHPCSTRFRAELPKDSLCLMETIKSRFGETDEGLTSDCSLVTRSFCEKSQKNRVRFKLPHTVIFYKPEEPYREDDEEEENEEALLRRYYSSSEEDSFSSPKCRELFSFETAEEPILRLAVDVLPHVFVSSKVSN
jgi:hypothetical protein